MRKDYVEEASAASEEAFVAGMWDRVWDGADVEPARLESLRSTDEYRFMADRGLLTGRPLDVLDCGCGTGQWTLFMRSQGHRAVGIDIAERTIERLRARHGDAFRCADFRRTGLPDASFDLVINWGGVEHFEEGPLPALNEAGRVLRPGGVFVATTPFHNVRIRLLDRWRGSGGPAAGTRSRFYQYRFMRRELEGFFRESGFERVASRAIAGQQGMTRALDHELRWLGRRLPGTARALVVRAGGRVLRPVLGHMLIGMGRKARVD